MNDNMGQVYKPIGTKLHKKSRDDEKSSLSWKKKNRLLYQSTIIHLSEYPHDKFAAFYDLCRAKGRAKCVTC